MKAWLAVPVLAASIEFVEVAEEDGRYTLTSDSLVAAPQEAVFEVLTDYDQFVRVSSAFEDSKVLDPEADGTPRVYTKLRGCVLFFCKTLERVEHLTYEAPGSIKTIVIAEESDFSYGVSTWELESVKEGTLVRYQLIMEPDFWIPPLIGPALIKRKLQRGGADAVDRIESLALGETPKPTDR